MPIGYGTWPLGGRAYGEVPLATAAAALEEAVGLGVRLFDTADIYGDGRAESLVGAALTSVRDATVVSKAGYLDERSGQQDFSDAHIRRSLDATLRRLHRDRVDIYLLHSPRVDVLRDRHALETLERLVEEGAVGRAGVSLRSVADWREAFEWPALSVVEVIFNLLDQRPLDLGLVEAAERRGVLVLARVPLCFGLLTRRYPAGAVFPDGDQRARWERAQLDRWIHAAGLFGFLERGDRSLAQAALGFCLAYPSVCPIPGMKTPAQVRHNAAAAGAGCRVTAGELEEIRDVWSGLRNLPPA